VASFAAQSYALNFFISNKCQRVSVMLASRIGLGRRVSSELDAEWSGINDAVALAETILASAHEQNIVISNTKQLVFAMRQGSAGPYQKMSLIAIEQNGVPAFYAKVAVGVDADVMVEAESSCLNRLSEFSELNGRVPRKFSLGKTPAGRSFFTTSVASFLKTNNQYDLPHMEFLCKLAHATVQWVCYADSLEIQLAKQVLKRLCPVLGETLHFELNSALEELLSLIGGLVLPTVLAHRDFSPWNMRSNNLEIFVFDWEYATEGINPLYDFFHFHLIQRVLSRWCSIPLTPAYVLPLTALALKHLQQTFPEVDWSLKIVKCLLLSYLVNLILLYVDSGKKYDPNHPVLSEYFNFIMKRKQWF